MTARMKRYTKEEFYRAMGWSPTILAERKRGRGLGARKRRRREARAKQREVERTHGGWSPSPWRKPGQVVEHTREEWVRIFRGY